MPKANRRFRFACIAMVSAGVAAGSLIGVESNAALTDEMSVVVDAAPVVIAPRASRASLSAPPAPAQPARAHETAQATPAADPAAASVIAMRFPPQWHAAASQQQPAPRQAMAYAAEPARAAAEQHAAPANPGYRLASVDPAPPLPKKRVAHPAPRKDPPLLFNDAQIASIKERLQLRPDQEHYWPAVATALRAISWRHATQSAGRKNVRGAPAAAIDPNSPEVQQLKSAAFPLIMSFNEAQKNEVRQLAHTMGLRKVAAMF
ncbi:MAG: hypothetical protein ACRECO_13245 [Xanthobacteraceae bacterium]